MSESLTFAEWAAHFERQWPPLNDHIRYAAIWAMIQQRVNSGQSIDARFMWIDLDILGAKTAEELDRINATLMKGGAR